MTKLLITSCLLMTGIAINAQTNAQAQQYLYYEQPIAAENTYHELLLQQPLNAEAWYGLTITYQLQEKMSKAKDSLALAPRSIHDQPFYQIAKGAVMLSENKNDSARIYFGDAINSRKKRKNPELLSAIAKAHIISKNGDASYAIELIEKAIKRKKHDPALYVLKGDAYLKMKNGNEAYKAYQEAILKNKNYAQAYHHLGELFMSQKNTAMYINYFKQAIAAEPDYAPSLHKLYIYEFNRDPAKAMDYYTRYLNHADTTIENEYEMASLLYLTHRYDEAIAKSRSIISNQKLPRPKLFKLMSYSYAEKGDTTSAMKLMERYFGTEADSNIIAKDYVAIASFNDTKQGNDSLVSAYYQKAVEIEKDSSRKAEYIKKLAKKAAEQKDYGTQAKWLAEYYKISDDATNVDLFNWGLAHYRDNNYQQADSVFTLYTEKYPDQSYGYYWLARVKSLEDTAMDKGIAVPVYKKLIETLEKDSTEKNYTNWMVAAYGYLAAYTANTLKNYPEAIEYFKKLLEVDPENESAKQYISVLEKSVSTNVN